MNSRRDSLFTSQVFCLMSKRIWGSKSVLTIFIIILLLINTPVKAQIYFPDFSSVKNLNFLGDAIQDTNKIRLTVKELDGQISAVWDSAQQEVQDGFQTTFQFQLILPANQNPADGFAFVIQNDDINAIGSGAGQNIGFSGIPNSLAIKFDTYQNGGDPNNNFVSVQSAGTAPNSADISFSLGYTTNIPRLVNDSIHTAKILYVPDSMQIFIDNLTIPVLTVHVKIDSLLNLNNGKAWVGFSASTGAETETAYILNWNYGQGVPIIESSKQSLFGALTCDSVRLDTIYIDNIGLAPLAIDSITLLNRDIGYYFPPTTSADSFSISSGDSAYFIVGFSSSTINGSVSDTVLIYNNDTILGHNPWQIILNGVNSIVRLSASSINFGEYQSSQFPIIKSQYIKNTGASTVTISAAYFNGIAPFVVVGGLPVTLAPGDFSLVTLRFDDPGKDSAYMDTLNFVYSPDCGQFTALVSGARGVTPPVIGALQQSMIPALLCQTSTFDTVIIHNMGGSALNITSGMFARGTQGFSLITPAMFPYSIPSGDSSEFIIQFIPSASPGMFYDTLVLANNDTASVRNPFRIAFSGTKDTNNYLGDFFLPSLSGSPGDTILMPIIVKSVNALDIGREFTFTIRYNPTDLLPVAAIRGKIDSINDGALVVTCIIGMGSDTAGLFKFIVGLGDSTTSALTIDSIWTDLCPLTASQTGGEFQLTGLCQQGGTRLFDATGNLSLSQNNPNPFIGRTDIAYSTIENGETQLFITDVLGRQVAILINGYKKAGNYSEQFNAHGLKSGVYFYVLQTPTQTLRRIMVLEK